jgi:hypothetical protein
MKEISEDYVQNQIWIWYTNNYCLKHHNPRGLIFSIPNGGNRNAREAKRLKDTGLLSGVSDLIVILPCGKLLFIEVKKPTGGVQSPEQKDFEARVKALGYEYHIVKSLDEFKNIIK